MRHRLLLHVIRAGAAWPLLLIGCDSPSSPLLPPPPPPPSLSLQIAGPSQVNAQGQFGWEAIALGGTGEYQYQWELTRDVELQPSTIGTQRAVSLRVTASDGDFVLTAMVTSGTQTRIQSLAVANCIDGCRAEP